MNKFIKPFNTFINESESGYYAPGTEHDPRAPWNQEDEDIRRQEDWIDQRGGEQKALFTLVESDYSEFALLKHKESGELYAAYVAGEEIEDYMPYAYEYVGRDEDGDADYDREPRDMDDLAIIAMATDLFKEGKVGNGISDWQDGAALCKADQEILDELSTNLGIEINEAKLPSKAHIDVDRLYAIQEKIKELKAELKQNEEEFKGFESQLKPIFDSMKVLEDKIATSEDYIIKITRYGHTREDVQWKPVVDMALERLDDAAKAVINECIEANKRVTQVKHSFDVKKADEEVNEASILGKIKAAIVAVIERFKSRVSTKLAKIDSENEKLSKLLAKVK